MFAATPSAMPARSRLVMGPLMIRASSQLNAGNCAAWGDFNGDGRDDVITFVRDTQAEPQRALWLSFRPVKT